MFERKSLQDRFDRVSDGDQSNSDNLLKFLELSKNASLSYESGNLAEKRQILKTVTSNFTVNGKNVVVSCENHMRHSQKEKKLLSVDRIGLCDIGGCRLRNQPFIWDHENLGSHLLRHGRVPNSKEKLGVSAPAEGNRFQGGRTP